MIDEVGLKKMSLNTNSNDSAHKIPLNISSDLKHVMKENDKGT